MKAIVRSPISRAILGAVLTAGLLAASTASADRGSSITTEPQRPPEEFVLSYLRPDDDNGRLQLVPTSPDGSDTSPTSFPGASSLQTNPDPAQGGVNGADDFKAGPGCSIQCITSGVAYARGPNAKLVVKTDTEARIWIHVSGPDGYYRVENSGADEVMEFGVVFDDLQAGTTYEAWAVAKDKENFESEAHGGFTTLERYVTISFSTAHLIERAYGSDADFKMDVWLNGAFDDDLTAHNLIEEDGDVLLGINFVEEDWVDRYLDFAIQLYEAPDYCNNLGNIDNPYFGPGSCSFLSFAELLEGENDLDARPDDATSWTEWTLNRTLELPAGLWPPYDDQLIFEVPVSLHVEYHPWWY
jgi:hypothetical protein